ncbi:hypothetical protein EVAR_98072_1 [Eumeta japonica]|uniref:Uncharacterized protein n=1 Tax=Eumeta variegata TaxID=151549 RepID=A0A4C1WBW2_EUMVA|nr:hypothetical protein EVAR_98072_1 [Eumeta japonica]
MASTYPINIYERSKCMSLPTYFNWPYERGQGLFRSRRDEIDLAKVPEVRKRRGVRLGVHRPAGDALLAAPAHR